ncbi:MAG: GHKL domain-containing protein [Myxococcales bacterium]|nr:GHKL domain-containing protein [Myxococcales bacterium]
MPSKKVRGRSVAIRWLLLGTNLLALTLPLGVVIGLRIYDTYLLRQTERQLIAQSVLIGELWRNAMVEEGLLFPGKELRPQGTEHKAFVPIEPRIGMSSQVWPPQPQPTRCTTASNPRFLAVAQRVVPTLKRSQIFTLSAVRLLDPNGCVVGTTRSEEGYFLGELPEVSEAKRGKYRAVVRQRISDQKILPWEDIRRRGRYRVFCALPIYSGGQVFGIVRLSRTSLSASRSLWLNRRGLVISATLSLVAVLLITLLFAQAITRPLSRLRKEAEAIVAGRQSVPLKDHAWSPTEFQLLSDSLTAMTQKLQERATYIADYAADLTHELKAPITAIRGAAELLMDTPQMADSRRTRFLNNIHTDVLRMDELVNRLLQLARLENQRIQDVVVAVEVVPFFSELLSSYAPRIQLCLNDPPDLIELDPLHLTSVVTNLVENALEKPSKEAVQVKLAQEDGRLRCTVIDRGPPIPEAHQNSIFERFFTTKKDEGGTGLGLTLTKAIVDHYGGKIWFETDENQTSFTVVV